MIVADLVSVTTLHGNAAHVYCPFLSLQLPNIIDVCVSKVAGTIVCTYTNNLYITVHKD